MQVYMKKKEILKRNIDMSNEKKRNIKMGF